MSSEDVTADDLELPIKRTTGDTIAERLTDNAYHNILPARYLRKDADGEPVESQEELFDRVARNVALAEAVFEAENHGVEITVTPDQIKPDHPRRDELAAEVFGAGVTADDDAETTLTGHNVNKFAYETIVPSLPAGVREHVKETAETFREGMESLSFMPNSPTLMNAGDELQQLSACFVDSPDDDITDIHQTAKEAAEVFQCLTADATVHVADKGLVSIADVEPGDSIRQRDGDDHQTRTVEAVHAYDDAPTMTLRTESGLTVRGTPNHRLLVDGDWTRLDEIEPDSTVSVRLGWLPEETEAAVELEAVKAGPQWAANRTVSNDAIAELHAAGLSDHTIAERLDSSSSTVQRRRADELNLPPNGTGGRSAGRSFEMDRLRALHEQGHTDAAIAAELGVHQTTVRNARAAEALPANGLAAKSVTQPGTLSTDLAELLGLWIGDGSVHTDGIRFHIAREETLERVDRLSRELFDTGADWTWSDGCYEVVIHSHEIKRFWLRNFGDAKPSSAEAMVPEAVHEASRDHVCAFVRGLFSADGTLSKDRYPRLYSASEDLVDGVQQLLLGVGIPATKWEWENDDREYYTVAPTDEVGLTRYAEHVGFVDERGETMADTIAETDLKNTTCGDVDGSEWTQAVTAVEQSDPATVYDVTVADNHEYVANSIVSHNSGGGMGYAFWQLRPYGDAVGSTGGIASGPITFMRTFDQMCETIAQGGARRGAQMGVMRVSHPDVIQFIHAKNKDVSLAHSLRLNDPDDFTHTSFADALEEARELIDDEGRVPEHLRNAVEGHLSNFNISVGVTDEFMQALYNDEEFTFTNPRTEEPHVATPETKELYEMFGLGEYVEVGEVLSIPAAELWDDMIEGAYENGEPGVIYLERVNKQHSFDVNEHPDHRILATNPCVTGDMQVQLADGTSIRIEKLADDFETVSVLSLDDDGSVTSRPARAFKTQDDAAVVRITTESGVTLRATPDHEVRRSDGDWVEAGDLSAGDSVVNLSKPLATQAGTDYKSDVETVRRVETDGSEDVYDLTVDETHNFFTSADGSESINVHNCGEQPLEEYEACNLGHINLSTIADLDAPDWRVWSDEHSEEYDTHEAAVEAFLEEAIDFETFDERIGYGTRFLENVVTMSDFPVEEIEQTVRDMRKIGLGIMGLAQLYIQLGVKYGSEAGNEVARQLMTHINHESKAVSHELAEARGVFNDWAESKYANPTEYREWFEHHTGLDADDWADGFPIRNHNTTTIAPTGCVDENSLVSTDEGLRRIDDLDNTTAEFEQWDEIEVGVSTDGGTKTATAVYDNGFAAVRQIETAEGFSVASTPNHRFRTIDEDGGYVWKEAGEFEAGDTILLQRGTFDGERRMVLDTSERNSFYHNTNESLSLPEEMTPELAEFLGYYMGDGYVHDGVGVKIIVDSSADALDEYLRELGESVFGVEPAVEDRDTRHVLTFGGRHLPRYFEDNGWTKDGGNEGEGAASAFVPTEVLGGDQAIAKAFLRGLFEADGTASRKIELSTVSSTLAEQVQTLLLALGCVFVSDVVEMKDRDDHYGDRPRYTLRGANKREDKRFLEEIGFITKSTSVDLTAQSYKNDSYPPAIVDELRRVAGYESVSRAVKHRVNQSLINGSVSRKLVRDIEQETGSTVTLEGRRLTDFYAATVGSVNEAKAYTKDISVPSNNTYVANGFVTHNTTSMIGNTTGGCEPIYNVAFYKNVSDDVQGDEMLVEFDDYFLRTLEANDIDVDAVKREAQEQMAANEFDGVEGLSTVPDAIGELFVVTASLSGIEHAAVQCACQEGVDSAISKTCNFPNDASAADMDEVYRYIYDHGGKGVTVYRDGTRSKQVLTTRAQNAEFADETEAAATIVEQIREVFGGVEAFLDNDDVQAAIDTEIAGLLESADDPAVEYTETRPRPDSLSGVTQRVETGYGKLYVTINEDEAGRPFELFANIGHSGGYTNSFTEALAKVISTALRSGVDPEEVVDELQGTRSPKVAWDKGEQIQSIPDAVGTALRRYLDDEIDKGIPQQQSLDDVEEGTAADDAVDAPGQTDGGAVGDDSAVPTGPAVDESTDDVTTDLIAAGESPECPECGAMNLYYSEGCKTCESCGWSEC